MLVFIPLTLPRSYGPHVQPMVITKQLVDMLQANAAVIAKLV